MTSRQEDAMGEAADLGRSGPPRAFCDEYIDVTGGDGFAGTYCKLLVGHEGPHSAHYPSEPQSDSPQEHQKVAFHIYTVGERQPIIATADPRWLREMVMSGSWFSFGEGDEETWVNGAWVVLVNRAPEVQPW